VCVCVCVCVCVAVTVMATVLRPLKTMFCNRCRHLPLIPHSLSPSPLPTRRLTLCRSRSSSSCCVCCTPSTPGHTSCPPSRRRCLCRSCSVAASTSRSWNGALVGSRWVNAWVKWYGHGCVCRRQCHSRSTSAVCPPAGAARWVSSGRPGVWHGVQVCGCVSLLSAY
jgi:hypothetical protein